MERPNSILVWILAAATWLAVISCSRCCREDLCVVRYMEFAKEESLQTLRCQQDLCATEENPTTLLQQQQDGPQWTSNTLTTPTPEKQWARRDSDAQQTQQVQNQDIQDQEAGDCASRIECGRRVYDHRAVGFVSRIQGSGFQIRQRHL